ncbi:hypothetical protein BDZ89DRAFT_1040913 [Hymenopellis radicata]|nr:hypothetical protein BDZ89DRAFT_1040913 [Hymenopellis radicata]
MWWWVLMTTLVWIRPVGCINARPSLKVRDQDSFDLREGFTFSHLLRRKPVCSPVYQGYLRNAAVAERLCNESGHGNRDICAFGVWAHARMAFSSVSQSFHDHETEYKLLRLVKIFAEFATVRVRCQSIKTLETALDNLIWEMIHWHPAGATYHPFREDDPHPPFVPEDSVCFLMTTIRKRVTSLEDY